MPARTTTAHGHDKPVFGCDECIAVADIGGDAKWFQVDVTRSLLSYYYLRANTRDAAQQDADEIQLDRTHFVLGDESSYVVELSEPPPPGEPYWTGGPDGSWETTTGG